MILMKTGDSHFGLLPRVWYLYWGKAGESQTECPLTAGREVATSFVPSSWQLCS